MHPQRRPDRSLGIVLVSDRGAEESDQSVSDHLVDLAAMGDDVLGQPLEAPVHQVLDQLGVQALRQRREPDEVGEDDGDHPALVDQLKRPTARRAKPGFRCGGSAASWTGHGPQPTDGGGLVDRSYLSSSGRTEPILTKASPTPHPVLGSASCGKVLLRGQHVRMAMDPAQLTHEHLAFLTERHLATLTTIRVDGSPHVVPVGFTYDPDRSVARVISFASSRKVANIAINPSGFGAICQVDGGRWLTLEGSCSVSSDPVRVAEAVAAYAHRYRQPKERADRVVLEISVERVIGRV